MITLKKKEIEHDITLRPKMSSLKVKRKKKSLYIHKYYKARTNYEKKPNIYNELMLIHSTFTTLSLPCYTHTLLKSCHSRSCTTGTISIFPTYHSGPHL